VQGKKVFITGMAGYIGSCLCRELEERDWCGRFFGSDVKPIPDSYRKGEFQQIDINDQALVDWIREIKPDMLVHLAFIVDPIHQGDLMNRVNVGGTGNILRAVKEAGVNQALIMSSATAYGAWPDNPVPLKESDPIRQHPHFPYAREKAQLEAMCAEFMSEHPQVALSIVRPCVVFGPNTDNYISGLFTMPVAIKPTEYTPPVQFVHEEDVVQAILTVLEKGGKGAYNLAPPDTMTVPEINDLIHRPTLPMPDWCLKLAFYLTWHLRLPVLKVPPSFIDFVRYPWVVDSTRLTEELGFSFRYSTRKTIEIMLQAKGLID